MSTRGALRVAGRPRVEELKVGDLVMHVRALSSAGRSAYVQAVSGDRPAAMHEIAILGICEEDGTLSYDATKPDDVAELAGLDGGLLKTAVLKILDISGLGETALADSEKKS